MLVRRRDLHCATMWIVQLLAQSYPSVIHDLAWQEVIALDGAKLKPSQVAQEVFRSASSCRAVRLPWRNRWNPRLAFHLQSLKSQLCWSHNLSAWSLAQLADERAHAGHWDVLGTCTGGKTFDPVCLCQKNHLFLRKAAQNCSSRARFKKVSRTPFKGVLNRNLHPRWC